MCNPGHIKTGKYFVLCIETNSYFTISQVPWGPPEGAGVTSSIGRAISGYHTPVQFATIPHVILSPCLCYSWLVSLLGYRYLYCSTSAANHQNTPIFNIMHYCNEVKLVNFKVNIHQWQLASSLTFSGIINLFVHSVK